MKHLVPGLFILFFCSSCASTEYVHISVLEPAPVTLPTYIRRVVVVNRSEPSQKAKVYNTIDKAISLESPALDQAGAAATVTGLYDELSKNQRFDSVGLFSGSALTTNSPGIFPAPLPWDEVERFCSTQHADALFSLELFDTHSHIDYAVHKTEIRTPLGNVPALDQQATMQTVVKAGWRIYDLKSKTILDEAALSRTSTFQGTGMNPLLAAKALIDRKEAVQQVGAIAGHDYAFSILPRWIRVTRDYYIKGDDNFKIATRKARTGNWDGAAELWSRETTNPSGKIAGRACYNMAIISEINGDIEGAIKWADRSYENFDNHLALNYVNVLKDRRVDNAIVAEQQAP